MGSRVEMFVVRPLGAEMPVILEVNQQEKKTLAELGVGNLTDVVIFDCDIGPENTMNKIQLYNIIGKKFDIDEKEYKALLPESTGCQDDQFMREMVDFNDGLSAPR